MIAESCKFWKTESFFLRQIFLYFPIGRSANLFGNIQLLAPTSTPVTGKSLKDFSNLYSPYDLQKNYDTILDYHLKLVIKKNETHVHTVKQLYHQLDNALKFRLNKLYKILNKYITTLDYVEMTLLVPPSANSGISLASFVTPSGALLG